MNAFCIQPMGLPTFYNPLRTLETRFLFTTVKFEGKKFTFFALLGIRTVFASSTERERDKKFVSFPFANNLLSFRNFLAEIP